MGGKRVEHSRAPETPAPTWNAWVPPQPLAAASQTGQPAAASQADQQCHEASRSWAKIPAEFVPSEQPPLFTSRPQPQPQSLAEEVTSTIHAPRRQFFRLLE